MSFYVIIIEFQRLYIKWKICNIIDHEHEFKIDQIVCRKLPMYYTARACVRACLKKIRRVMYKVDKNVKMPFCVSQRPKLRSPVLKLKANSFRRDFGRKWLPIWLLNTVSNFTEMVNTSFHLLDYYEAVLDKWHFVRNKYRFNNTERFHKEKLGIF